MTPIHLSRRQIGDADRVGGIELLILWPADILGPEPADLQLDHEREATPAERAAAEALLAAAKAEHRLVPVHTRVCRVRRPAGLPAAHEERTHLAVTLIGHRWVHASTSQPPRTAYAAAAT
jgi:hypothetical protein